MKIVMTLKSGLILELPLQKKEEIELILQQMKSFKRFFSWDKRIWVNKREIASFEIVEMQQNLDQTV